MSNPENLIVDRYELGQVIGRGGMADVYLGTDTKLGRKVAVKVLRSNLANDSAFRVRFQQEAAAASKMTHPGIVRVFDAGEDYILSHDTQAETQPFIVMEWVEGRILKDIIAEGPLPVAEALDLTDQVLSALQYSHRAGIVHRDIKPSNIIVTDDGKAKITDFGIARAVSDSSATVEETSTVLGTAQYFSPEQARGETVDQRTDLYSLGVTLFELLTGEAPFKGETAVAVAYQHVNAAPPKPSSIVPELPEALDRLVLMAITKNKNARFQSASNFRAAIKGAAAGELIDLPESELSLDELFEADPSSEEVFRELSGGQTELRGNQKKPPAVWLWVSILSIFVILGAVVYWVLNLSPFNPVVNESVAVPDVSGYSWEAAEATLKSSDLRFIQRQEDSPTVPEGSVISTEPAAETMVKRGEIIRVTISSGPKKVRLVSYANQSLTAVQNALEALDLELGTITKSFHPTIAADVVIGTDPVAGVEVLPGSVVNIVVSNGQVEVPSVVGLPLADAQSMLTGPNYGLRVRVAQDNSCAAGSGNPIISQSLPPAPTAQRSEITLTYCTGPSS